MEIDEEVFSRLFKAAKEAQAELFRLYDNQSELEDEDIMDIALVDENVLGDLEEAIAEAAPYSDDDDDEDGEDE